MGTNPVPIERHMARGINGKTLGGRDIEVRDVSQMPVIEPPAMPAGLAERGQVEWQKIWTAGRWLWPDMDYIWVEFICKAMDRISLFEARILEDGPMVPGTRPKQMVAHPLYAEISAAQRTVEHALSRIGFSPTDRAKLKLAELRSEKKAQDILNNPGSPPRVVPSYVEGEW